MAKQRRQAVRLVFTHENKPSIHVQRDGVDVGQEVKVEPKAGSVCCFPPHWTFPHKGATPISGPKYVISSYVWLPNTMPVCDPITKKYK